MTSSPPITAHLDPLGHAGGAAAVGDGVHGVQPGSGHVVEQVPVIANLLPVYYCIEYCIIVCIVLFCIVFVCIVLYYS